MKLKNLLSEIDLNPTSEPTEEQRTRRGRLLYIISTTINELVRRNKTSTDPISFLEEALTLLTRIKESDLYRQVEQDSQINEDDKV